MEEKENTFLIDKVQKMIGKVSSSAESFIQMGRKMGSYVMSKKTEPLASSAVNVGKTPLAERSKMFSALDENTLALKQTNRLYESKLFKISPEDIRVELKTVAMDIGKIALSIDQQLISVAKVFEKQPSKTEELGKFKNIIDEMINLNESVLKGQVVAKKDAERYIRKLKELHDLQIYLNSIENRQTKEAFLDLQRAVGSSSQEIIGIQETISTKWNKTFKEKIGEISTRIENLPVTDELASALGMAVLGPLFPLLEQITGARGIELIKKIALGIITLPLIIVRQAGRLLERLRSLPKEIANKINPTLSSAIGEKGQIMSKLSSKLTSFIKSFETSMLKGSGGGEGLVAGIPLLISKTVMIGLGKALAVAGVAFAGWNIGKLVNEQLEKWGVNIFESIDTIIDSVSRFFTRIINKVKGFFGMEATPSPTPATGEGAKPRRYVAEAVEKGRQIVTSGKETVRGIGEKLGFISAKYESGKAGYGAVSTGKGDVGGASYGKYQFASKTNTLSDFLTSTGYSEQFKGLTPGTKEYSDKWKELAKDERFQQAQDAYIKRTHYDPAAEFATKKGFDMNDPRMQEAIFSASVQHGGVKNIIKKASATEGWDKMTPEQKIQTFYKEREKYAVQAMRSGGASEKVIEGVVNRYGKEQKDILAMRIPVSQPQETMLASAAVTPTQQKQSTTATPSISQPEAPTLPAQALGTTANITEASTAATVLASATPQSIVNNVNTTSSPTNTTGGSNYPQQFPVVIDDLGIVLANSGLV